jgi:hypothetical protein
MSMRMSSNATHRRAPNSDAVETDNPPQRQRPRWSLWAASTVLTFAVLIATSVLSPYVRHEWALSLWRQDPAYTELGFNDAAALPVHAMHGKAIRVSFAITNDGSGPVSYRYTIMSGSGARLDPLSSATGTVAPGETWNVDKWIVPKCSQAICRVQVAVPQVHERIYFILTLTHSASNDAKDKKH